MTVPTGPPDNVLLDTNVLVRLYDRGEPGKQQQAREVLAQLAESGTGCVSTQILCELHATLTGKLREQITAEEAVNQLEHHSRIWRVIQLTVSTVVQAARGARDFRMNFWDALIWSAARSGGVGLILSEDFSHGTSLGGVRFVNPFHPGFRVADWL